MGAVAPVMPTLIAHLLQLLQPPTPDLQDAALVVATNRDPTNYPYGGKPSNDTTMYCTTHTGGMQV